jgi:adenylate kinase
MIIIFLGAPYSGKGTQSEILGKQLSLPVFSMGELIRKERREGNPVAVKAYEDYSMKGLHLPNDIKFPWLKTKLDQNKSAFILDNYPASQEDLDVFIKYLAENSLHVNKVFYIHISVEEMNKRMILRSRPDDDPEVVLKRKKQQDLDRFPVLDYYKKQKLLEEINGKDLIENINQAIRKSLQ